MVVCLKDYLSFRDRNRIISELDEKTAEICFNIILWQKGRETEWEYKWDKIDYVNSWRWVMSIFTWLYCSLYFWIYLRFSIMKFLKRKFGSITASKKSFFFFLTQHKKVIWIQMFFFLYLEFRLCDYSFKC